MARESKLTATARTGAGSSVSNRLRRQGQMPGVIYNNKGKSELVQMSRHEFERLMHDRVGENLVLDLAVEGKDPRKVLLREVQRHPVTDAYLHADFLEVSMTEKMRVRVPIRLLGEPEGVSQEGGILEQPLREVEVECLPGDMVEQIDADVSALKIGDAIFVGDLKVDPKLTIVTGKGIAVAIVSAPKAEEEVAAPAEGVATGEPEVIGAKKDDEEGAEGEGAEGEKKADDKGKKPAEDKGKKPAEDKGKKPAGDDKGKKPDGKKPEGRKPEGKK